MSKIQLLSKINEIYKSGRNEISFQDFLDESSKDPDSYFQNIFQIFRTFIKTYVGEGQDEYPNDPESINYVWYDSSELFEKDHVSPFFPDRLFMNRFVNAFTTFYESQQNKIYIIKGPHGCGKSTFLSNLIDKFEYFANFHPNGATYKLVWKLTLKDENDKDENIDIECPNNDHPIFVIPKNERKMFLKDLIEDDETFKKILNSNEFNWLFTGELCSICNSLLTSYAETFDNLFDLLYVKRRNFDRKTSNGTTIYNPTDEISDTTVNDNQEIQKKLDKYFKDSNKVRYIYSDYAPINDGIYSIMDIKENNITRLQNLHGLVSEGIHKVKNIEEKVTSLFFVIMNDEDEKGNNNHSNIASHKSFKDRQKVINLNYILDDNTEIEIYKHKFGEEIKDYFMPRILESFAKTIISTRMKAHSDAIKSWISSYQKYTKVLDDKLRLLRIELYKGHVPLYVTEEDRKNFTHEVRKQLINEAEDEGKEGISGREAIEIFNDFFTKYKSTNKLINIEMLTEFIELNPTLNSQVMKNFLTSLVNLYNYTILQEIKECLFMYNLKHIENQILNYLYIINCNLDGSTMTCPYTNNEVKLVEKSIKPIEDSIFGYQVSHNERTNFRKKVLNMYVTKTIGENIDEIRNSKQVQDLVSLYSYNLKKKALQQFKNNNTFREAVKDFDTNEYEKYDEKIKWRINYLIDNLVNNYNYSYMGAKEAILHVIDNKIEDKFDNDHNSSNISDENEEYPASSNDFFPF